MFKHPSNIFVFFLFFAALLTTKPKFRSTALVYIKALDYTELKICPTLPEAVTLALNSSIYSAAHFKIYERFPHTTK